MIATLHTIAKSVYFSLVYFQKRDLSPTPKAHQIARISLISAQYHNLLHLWCTLSLCHGHSSGCVTEKGRTLQNLYKPHYVCGVGHWLPSTQHAVCWQLAAASCGI